MKSFDKKLIPVRSLANGDQQSIQVFTIKGREGGPKVHIQASVHGAEIQGNAVIYELLKVLKEKDSKEPSLIELNLNEKNPEKKQVIVKKKLVTEKHIKELTINEKKKIKSIVKEKQINKRTASKKTLKEN